MAYTPGKNCIAIAAQEHTDQKLKRLHDAKGSYTLKEIGKISAFKEYFEKIKLEDQDLPKIETVENITENKFFLEGRKFGFTLISNGFNEEMYKNYNQAKKHR